MSSSNLKMVTAVLAVVAILGLVGFVGEYFVGQAQVSTDRSKIDTLVQNQQTLSTEFVALNNTLYKLVGSTNQMVALTNGLVTSSHSNSQITTIEEQLVSTPRIGILNTFGGEQAPILAAMNTQAVVNISGWTFYLGTLNGQAVVNVRSGMQSYSAELATYIMDTHFNLIANILSGEAGSANSNINVGDVVVSGFVVDKQNVHYFGAAPTPGPSYQGPYYQAPYDFEMMLQPTSFYNSSYVQGYDQPGPTPQNAANYTSLPFTNDTSNVMLDYLPASLGLDEIAAGAASALSPTPLAYVTGNNNLTGTEPSQVMVGVSGESNVWTEPLAWNGAQNALYQTDSEANEGMGFAFANAQVGIPWLIVRGISDSPWYPNTYQGTWANVGAANVTMYIVQHFTTTDLYKTATMKTLSPDSNAATHGYIVANAAYYTINGVTEVQYQAQNGTMVTQANPSGTEYDYPPG
jgi:adenosylhomocysteine nucleosidase